MKDAFTHTSASTVYFKTLQQFLAEVPVMEVNLSEGSDLAEYNAQLGFSPGFSTCEYGAVADSYFVRKYIDLEARENINYFNQLNRTVAMLSIPKPNKAYDLFTVMEDKVVELTMEYAEITMAVPVANRTWLLANPKDFKILKDRASDKQHIVCVCPTRSRMYKVEK